MPDMLANSSTLKADVKKKMDTAIPECCPPPEGTPGGDKGGSGDEGGSGNDPGGNPPTESPRLSPFSNIIPTQPLDVLATGNASGSLHSFPAVLSNTQSILALGDWGGLQNQFSALPQIGQVSHEMGTDLKDSTPLPSARNVLTSDNNALWTRMQSTYRKNATLANFRYVGGDLEDSKLRDLRKFGIHGEHHEIEPADIKIGMDPIQGGGPEWRPCNKFLWSVYYNMPLPTGLSRLGLSSGWIVQHMFHFMRLRPCGKRTTELRFFFEYFEAFPLDGGSANLSTGAPVAWVWDPNTKEWAAKAKVPVKTIRISPGEGQALEDYTNLGADTWHYPILDGYCGRWLTEANLFWVLDLPKDEFKRSSEGDMPAGLFWTEKSPTFSGASPDALRFALTEWKCCNDCLWLKGDAGFKSRSQSLSWSTAEPSVADIIAGIPPKVDADSAAGSADFLVDWRDSHSEWKKSAGPEHDLARTKLGPIPRK